MSADVSYERTSISFAVRLRMSNKLCALFLPYCQAHYTEAGNGLQEIRIHAFLRRFLRILYFASFIIIYIEYQATTKPFRTLLFWRIPFHQLQKCSRTLLNLNVPCKLLKQSLII